MTHELIENRPMLYPDGGVFLAVASIALDKSSAIWRAPLELHGRFRPIVCEIDEENCLDAAWIAELSHRLNEALGLRERTIAWRIAASYGYLDERPPRQSAIPTRSNRGEPLPDGIKRDRYFSLYTGHPYATCHVEDGEIASICFADNPAITIMTKPAYRRRGFGEACLRRIAAELLSDGLRPGYGTAYDNRPSRKTAEAAGFSLAEYMYWLEIDAEHGKVLSGQLRRIIESGAG